MLRVLWEIVLPLLIAFVVGWVVMGWLTWRWRRAGVSQAQWAGISDELERARSRLGAAEAKVADLESTAVARSNNGNGASAGNGTDGTAVASMVESPASDPPTLDDELTAIRGVGKKMEAKLQELGVTSLRQVAAFTADDIERISAGLGAFPGRIERDRWVPQAKELVTRLPDEHAEHDEVEEVEENGDVRRPGEILEPGSTN